MLVRDRQTRADLYQKYTKASELPLLVLAVIARFLTLLPFANPYLEVYTVFETWRHTNGYRFAAPHNADAAGRRTHRD